jgi:two-component system NarL family sensor kinase
MRLGAFSRSLKVAGAAGTDSSRLAEQAVSLIAAHFEWPFAAVMERVGDDFIMRAVYACGKMKSPHSHLGPDAGEWLRGIGRQHRYASRSGQEAAKLISLWGLPPMELSSLLAAPVPDAGLNTPWIIAVGCGPGSGEYEHVDGDALEAIGEHFAVLLESALLEENRRELARLDERNRLARDLHDSVCQMLFSLSMTAKGTESLLGASGQELDAARLAVKDMQSLSQQALKEMRELIMQLRPAGLETGLVAALKAYGEKLGLQVHTRLAGICELPRQIEEALWRIGQEALNNVSKHAGVGAANVSLQLTREEAQLCISDCGRGVSKQREPKEAASIGLHSMRERTEALGGRFTLTSLSEGGTVVEAVIPIPSPNHSS